MTEARNRAIAGQQAGDLQPWRCARCGTPVRKGYGDWCKCLSKLEDSVSENNRDGSKLMSREQILVAAMWIDPQRVQFIKNFEQAASRIGDDRIEAETVRGCSSGPTGPDRGRGTGPPRENSQVV